MVGHIINAMEFYESVQGFIATLCPVCGSRLYFKPEQAGGELLCGMCQERVEIPKEILIRPKRKTVYKRVEQYEINEDYAPAEPPINEVKPAAPRSGDFAIVEPDEPPGSPEPAPAKRQGEFASGSQQNTAETRKPAEKP